MRLTIACAALTLSTYAHADECIAVSLAKGATEESKGTWTALTDLQVAFMHGVWARDPSTPDRIAYGDAGAVAKRGDKITVFFIDGDLACDPMEIGATGYDKLVAVGAGEINHAPLQGDGL